MFFQGRGEESMSSGAVVQGSNLVFLDEVAAGGYYCDVWYVWVMRVVAVVLELLPGNSCVF